MILEAKHFNHEDAFIIDNPAVNDNVKYLKDKIETALQDVENIKVMKPKISWISKNIFNKQNENEESGNDIVLCLAIKMKKKNGNVRNRESYVDGKVQPEHVNIVHNGESSLSNQNNGKDENQSLSPELKFHSTNIFTKKREMLDIMNKSKTKDIDDDSPASYTVRSDDDDDDSTLSDISITDTKQTENNESEDTAQLSQSASWFKEIWNKRKSQDSFGSGSGGNQNSGESLNCNDNDNEKEINTNEILPENNNISQPIPKSAPNSPLKKASLIAKLQRSQSSEQTNSIGLNTREGSAYNRIRRIRSRHSQSLERIWLPGRSTSFNARVSERFVKRDERSMNSQYYFLSHSKQSTCYQTNA